MAIFDVAYIKEHSEEVMSLDEAFEILEDFLNEGDRTYKDAEKKHYKGYSVMSGNDITSNPKGKSYDDLVFDYKIMAQNARRAKYDRTDPKATRSDYDYINKNNQSDRWRASEVKKELIKREKEDHSTAFKDQMKGIRDRINRTGFYAPNKDEEEDIARGKEEMKRGYGNKEDKLAAKKPGDVEHNKAVIKSRLKEACITILAALETIED